jgi:hypothetical protein
MKLNPFLENTTSLKAGNKTIFLFRDDNPHKTHEIFRTDGRLWGRYLDADTVDLIYGIYLMDDGNVSWRN